MTKNKVSEKEANDNQITSNVLLKTKDESNILWIHSKNKVFWYSLEFKHKSGKRDFAKVSNEMIELIIKNSDGFL